MKKEKGYRKRGELLVLSNYKEKEKNRPCFGRLGGFSKQARD